MKATALLAVLSLTLPARAQTRSASVARPVLALPALGPAPAVLPQAAPALAAAPNLAPSLSPAPALAAAVAAPVVAAPVVAARGAGPAAARVAALNAGAARGLAALTESPASASAALGAGRDLEALLTGAALAAPSASDAAASPEELAFAAGASRALAARADDLAGESGLKASGMTGGDFLALLERARASAPPAPSPAAAAAAREVEIQVVRVARALLPADRPLSEGIGRAMAVWQVFDQEMALAAEKGALGAVVAEARLFASQVEASVDEPARRPAPLAPAEVRPEDPEGYAAVSVPGSIFGWKPIESSPNHGLPPLDALIRFVLSEKKSGYAAGFELPGASSREKSRVHFYGERHTDGELIAANMARLVEDARPDKPMTVLVEGYTGWSMRGWAALKYLADRGLDARALAEKGVDPSRVEVRGWDSERNYDASKHPLLQHHMDLLALNHLAHGETRGWRYYRDMARAALAAWRGYRELWRAAIVVRNGDLDRAVAAAVAQADETGGTVHVVAGTDHLMQNPRLAGWPLIGRPSFRKSLRAALAGRPFWASQPPNTLD